MAIVGFPGQVVGEAPDVRRVLSAKEFSQARFAAAHADPRKLAQEMFEAAEQSYFPRLMNLVAGHGSLDLTLASVRRLEEAELAVLGKDADVARVAEQRWERMC
jgi:hypothetical protein